MSSGVRAWAFQRLASPLLMALALLVPALPLPALASAKTAPRTVLVLGDSLSAAYGLAPEQGWVALLGQRLQAQRPGWQVANASISGETSAGGRSRIARELQRHRPQLLVLALGANDGLRGLPLEQTRSNLAAIIEAAQAAKARVLLVGMRMPPNYGPDYTRGFEQNYTALAGQYHTALLPFLLEPIARERDAFQADNLHPVAGAQPRLLEHVWAALAPLLPK